MAPFLDLSDPAFSVRSPEALAAREASWFASTPFGIAVLRHEDVGALILHPGLRQGSYRWPELHGATGPWARWWTSIMLSREGPDHLRLRKSALPAFSPARHPGLAGRVAALARELAGALPDGRCEFVGDFAEPFAARVLCFLIGLEERHWPKLAADTAVMGLALGVEYAAHAARIDAATLRLRDFAADLLASAPGGFAGALLSPKAGLIEEERLDMIVLAIFGGIDTTRAQLGLAMQCFLDHPGQWARLRADPSLAEAAVEEVMRVRPTITWVTREATEDLEHKGLAIPKGTVLHLISGLAGTDPAAFAPGFDIGAARARHYGFGAGRHHCIGAPVARMDMAEALRALAARIEAPEPDGPGDWLPDSGNTGPRRLPVRYR